MYIIYVVKYMYILCWALSGAFRCLILFEIQSVYRICITSNCAWRLLITIFYWFSFYSIPHQASSSALGENLTPYRCKLILETNEQNEQDDKLKTKTTNRNWRRRGRRKDEGKKKEPTNPTSEENLILNLAVDFVYTKIIIYRLHQYRH